MIGEAAHLAPAHRIGLAGDGKGSHAGPADPPGREMTIDDRVDLVGSSRGLVDALAEDRHDLFGAREERIEGAQLIGRNTGLVRNLVER